jgi:hypothetical protein
MPDDQYPKRDMYEVHGLTRRDPVDIAVACAESPIEAKMIRALLEPQPAEVFWYEGDPIIVPPETAYKWPEQEPGPESLFIVALQHYIGRARVDIACAFTGTGRRVVVECDGFDFHERTQKQAEDDRARDAALLAKDWPVVRFMGSQINKDATQCAWTVFGFLNRGWQ